VDACPIYTWVAGSWDSCSASCGSGTQTRSVDCYSSAGNVIVPSGCDMSLKPEESQACNLASCEGPHWHAGEWSNCTEACGGGVQSRTVQCLDASELPTSGCVGVSPPSTRSCNLVVCDGYHWDACATFYPCSAQCAADALVGTQERDVFCRRDSDNAVVDELLCDPTPKPSALLTVCNTQACTGYNWAGDPWGPCTLQFDGSWERMRTFQCHAADGSPALQQNCIQYAGPKPISVLPCTLGTCASPTGCPFVEIGATFANCDLAMLQSCNPNSQCGSTAAKLDKTLNTLQSNLNSAMATQCVPAYVSSLASGQKPATATVNYVIQQLKTGNQLCGTMLSTGPAGFPVNNFRTSVLFNVFLMVYVFHW